MSEKTLYLFPDTNLFVQCRKPSELPWDQWPGVTHVKVIVCKAVQREIDWQKKRGNDRLGRRARSASSLFRTALLNEAGDISLRSANPQVLLSLRPDLQPDPGLRDRLDYQERDDQLVGTVAAFRSENPDSDVRLLTHDTGPMLTARMLGIPVELIPDTWLLPPEATEDEKRIGALEAQLAALKRQEPDFRISCLNASDQPASSIDAELLQCSPLTPSEVTQLVDLLRERFPAPSESELAARPSGTIAAFRHLAGEVFVPPTDEQIALYLSEEYPKWLEECEALLVRWHRLLQHTLQLPRFCFSVANAGTRPGQNVLISLAAEGPFRIAAPVSSKKRLKRKEATRLPIAPAQPTGKWRQQYTVGLSMNPYPSALLSMMYDPTPLQPTSLLSKMNFARRDPSRLYWKTRSRRPVSFMELECEQWRHGIEPRRLTGDIHPDGAKEAIGGAIECRLHADNLSSALSLRVPVRIIRRQVSTYDSVVDAIESLGSSFDGGSSLADDTES